MNDPMLPSASSPEFRSRREVELAELLRALLRAWVPPPQLDAAAQAIYAALTLRESQESISRWAEKTFGPAGSNARAVARANREMAELLEHVTSDDRHPEAAEEVADVVIVLYRVATRLGVDLHELIEKKMAKNRARTWQLDGTGHGYHVKETPSTKYAKKREHVRAVRWTGEVTPEVAAILGSREFVIGENRRMALGNGWYADIGDWIISDDGEKAVVIGNALFESVYEKVSERDEDRVITRQQCIICHRRLAHERASDGSDPQVCVECRAGGPFANVPNTAPGIPLAGPTVLDGTGNPPAHPTTLGEVWVGKTQPTVDAIAAKTSSFSSPVRWKRRPCKHGTLRGCPECDWLAKIEALKPGDACEFHYPARTEWILGTVDKNGGAGYWSVRDADGTLADGLYIEMIRLPGQEDAWPR